MTDVFLTILPGVLIEHTRLSLKNKIGLAFLLCLSILYDPSAGILHLYWLTP
jgi:hypothetical protein